MPSTTNFGWTTPADTDLVKDGAAAIRTLGNGVDASFVDLKGGTTGQVLSKNSNTDLDFAWVAQDDSNAIQNALLTTTGDTIYASSASTPARLGIGSTGQVLTVSGGVPTWATPSAGGKVLQVVYGSYGTEVTINTTTWTDTGVSASITPSATSSKILVIATGNGTNTGADGTANTWGEMRLVRGSTTILNFENRIASSYASAVGIAVATSCVYLDSPSTTSSTTYKTQAMRGNGTSTFRVNGNNITSGIILMEIGA